MFKRMSLIGVLAGMALIVAACGSKPASSEIKAPEQPKQAAAAPAEKAKEPVAPAKEAPQPGLTEAEMKLFKDYVPKIKGATFVKLSEIRNSNEAYIEYYPSYKDYKGAHADSKLTEKDYTGYFSTGDAINKILMEESIRLHREFPALTKINLVVPYSGKTYSVESDKKAMETYLGVNFKEINEDKSLEKWKALSSKFFTKQERENYAKKFIKSS